jgi:hypothetical protein
MFGKKVELPKLSYFILKVNLAAIEQWLSNQRKILPSQEIDWEKFDVKEYKITILPTDPFTFYHNQANEFSPSIGGFDIISNNNISCIEWFWNQSYFCLTVSDPIVQIFAAPIDEMFHLLKTGRNLSGQPFNDKGVIKLGSDELFDELHRSGPISYSLKYSNELVSLTLVRSSPDDRVSY